MMQIQSIAITDFRSIRGLIFVPLNAPMVLIHGQNGAGKTSILSALELALTGQVQSLGRIQSDYLASLPHQDVDRSVVKLVATGFGSQPTELGVTRSDITGSPLLDERQAHFFSERSFLAQATLSRLLDIYQHKDTRKSDSPLTEFVKELLGLRQLDDLIEGLHDAGDVRRLREPVPAYQWTRDRIADAERAIAEIQEAVSRLADEDRPLEARLRSQVPALVANGDVLLTDLPALLAQLEISAENATLTELTRARRDLAALTDEWRPLRNTPGADDRRAAEERQWAAEAALMAWTSDPGEKLSTIIRELSADYAGLASPSDISPQAAWKAASDRVTTDLARHQADLKRNEEDNTLITRLTGEVARGQARIEALDKELAEAAENNKSLARALADLLPHIQSNICPVCNRDFAEVSPAQSLAGHLSEHIAMLSEQAGRLQSLAKDKAGATATVTRAKRQLAELQARQFAPEALANLKDGCARLDEIQRQLQTLETEAMRGSTLQATALDASRQLAALRGRDERLAKVRADIAALVVRLDLDDLGAAESIDEAIGRMNRHIEEREAHLAERETSRHKLAIAVRTLIGVRESRTSKLADIKAREEELKQRIAAKAEADKRLQRARDLAKMARDTRTEVVRRVFNESLNAVWKDLFVRLAPEEPFVPAFALPETSTGPVEAMLETLYRSGGKGGDPRVMLSAGNLNTAALTLVVSRGWWKLAEAA